MARRYFRRVSACAARVDVGSGHRPRTASSGRRKRAEQTDVGPRSAGWEWTQRCVYSMRSSLWRVGVAVRKE